MQQVVIENPVINSPFDEPSRHFKFDETGITNDIATIRRPSSYFVPIPRPEAHWSVYRYWHYNSQLE